MMQRLFSLLLSLALLIPCGCGQSLPAANAVQDPPAVAVPEDIPAPPEAPAELPAEPSEPEPPAPTTATRKAGPLLTQKVSARPASSRVRTPRSAIPASTLAPAG